MIRRALLALGLTLISGSSAWAIPQTLNFQGFLKESGSPVGSATPATRQMVFKIWDSLSGGTAMFTEPPSGTTDVTVSTGIFNVVIGTITSGGIPLSVFDGSDRFIEVIVGGITLPRQKITSVANSFFAATAANLSTNAAIQISSAVFTATGPNQFSLQTPSGINVQGGGVTAPYFSGTFTGNGAGLTGLSGTDSTKVAKTGDTMTGQLTLAASTLTVTGNAFAVGGSSFAVAAGRIGVGTASPATKFHLSSGTMTIDGSGAGLTVAGPSSATYFYGNGSGLTSLTGTDSTKVSKTGDTMTGQLTLSGSTLTVAGNAFSVGGTTMAVVGGSIGVGTTSPATKIHMSSGSLTVDGSGAGMSVVGPSSATYFYGNGSGLTSVSDNGKIAKTGDTMTGQLTLSGSTLTVTGNAFSVGGTTLSLTSGRVGIGTTSPATKLHLNAGALTIDGSGAGMNVSGPSTATYFYGNGSGLTGVVPTSFYNLVFSSISTNAIYTLFPTTNWQAIVGSETPSLTVPANAKVRLRMHMSMRSPGSAVYYARMMRDSTPAGTGTGYGDCISGTASGNTENANCDAEYIIGPLSAGSYKFSIMAQPRSVEWLPDGGDSTISLIAEELRGL